MISLRGYSTMISLKGYSTMISLRGYSTMISLRGNCIFVEAFLASLRWSLNQHYRKIPLRDAQRILYAVFISNKSKAKKFIYCVYSIYDVKKQIVSKLLKISIPNFDFVKILRHYFQYFPRNKPSKSVTFLPGRVGSGRLII